MALLASCLAGPAAAASATGFLGLDRFGHFENVRSDGSLTLTSPWLVPGRSWNELVVSWNVTVPPGTRLTVEARARRADLTTPFYGLGVWSGETAPASRGSIRGQKDSLAEVKTDTLVCRQLMDQVQVRFTFGPCSAAPARGRARLPPSLLAPAAAPQERRPTDFTAAVPGGLGRAPARDPGDGPDAAQEPELKFVGLCASDTSVPWTALEPQRAAWARTLEVPRRSQLGHPGASGWCSPTALSMALAYWAGVLGREELDLSVPEVAANVRDPVWDGTGNWAFNTAFAGHFRGLRAYVARLEDVPEIEEWILAGIPVIASVSFDLLNGRPQDEGDGHLIVVAGFTKSGDIVANDPWPNPKKENSVRRVFPRENFRRAWARSHHTVYLIHPLSVAAPPARLGHWE